ncbi:F0F1 ATP synthase subunit B [Paucilactobacillus suebicus]|uniref:ATP synthase subunit b n=1 Tax=Paucilactobacillus suebicus DSM 5007 = KCTC 3549 TaxID=1423807 RepID=A0A0R1W7N4_9LACO|nr:F0F1 ATP synthase subunit B [Paucilactobacillus suebicus]KRM13519.1 F0F1 ATP synthase subunit B [Paucilactobacillus suebicus DSM 5007 = KCTC 3549]
MFAQSVLAESNSLYVGDMIFYIISFVILMLLVKKFAWKPVVKMMHDRAEKIANDIDSAEQSRNEASDLATKRQSELQNSRQEAATIIGNAKQSGEKQRSQIVASAQNDAQALKENAEQDAKQARQDALKSAQNDVANLSIEIASKIIHKELNADDQKALIDSYIEGLGKDES